MAVVRSSTWAALTRGRRFPDERLAGMRGSYESIVNESIDPPVVSFLKVRDRVEKCFGTTHPR